MAAMQAALQADVNLVAGRPAASLPATSLATQPRRWADSEPGRWWTPSHVAASQPADVAASQPAEAGSTTPPQPRLPAIMQALADIERQTGETAWHAQKAAGELRDIERNTFFLERRSDSQASTYLDIERHLQQAGKKDDGSLGSQAFARKHRSQYEADLRWQASQAGCFAFVAMVICQLRWRRTIQTAFDETQTDDVQPVQPEILPQTDDVQPVQPEI